MMALPGIMLAPTFLGVSLRSNDNRGRGSLSICYSAGCRGRPERFGRGDRVGGGVTQGGKGWKLGCHSFGTLATGAHWTASAFCLASDIGETLAQLGQTLAPVLGSHGR